MIEAEHLCMSMRGVRKPGTLTVTSAVRGLFKDNPATRAEVMAMLTPRAEGSEFGRSADRRFGAEGRWLVCEGDSPRPRRPSPAGAHGGRQRHSRLLLRRRAASLDAEAAVAHGLALGRNRARRCSTSAASRPDRAPSRSTADEELRRVDPGRARARRRVHRAGQHRHDEGGGRGGRARGRRRDRQRRVRRHRRCRRCCASSPTPAPCSSLMHMRGTPRTMRSRSPLRRRGARGRRRAARRDRRGASTQASTPTRCSPIPASGSRRRPSTTSRCSPRSPSSRPGSGCRCSSARRASRSSARCSATRRSTRAKKRRWR